MRKFEQMSRVCGEVVKKKDFGRDQDLGIDTGRPPKLCEGQGGEFSG